MVLPPSVADDAPGPDVTSWLRRLKVILELSRAGVLVLVDHAYPERLGDLVRALLPTHPELEVHSDARKLVGVKPGATVVLVPRAEDADWLNINRPLFAVNGLRVVLFASREVSVALARGAVDFFDWISHRLDCPPGPAPFAVAGLRRALAIRAPGIIWKGGDLVAAFRAVRPRRRLRTISAARPYEELVAEVRAVGREWIAWTDVDGEFRLRRVRWALAEARRRTRAILVEPAVPSPGWWAVHGHVTRIQEAHEQLERAGARHAGRLAALMDLEPEAIEFLGALLRQGIPEQTLEAEMSGGADAGAVIGRLATVHGLVSEKEVVRGTASPPAVRAFSERSREYQRMQELEVATVLQRLAQGPQVGLADAAWLSASTKGTNPIWASRDDLGRRGEVAEVWLRHEPRRGKTWDQLALVSLRAGDLQVAHLWARRAFDSEPDRCMVLAQVLTAQGRWTEAEPLLRKLLTSESGKRRNWALYELARVVEKQGAYEEAERLLRQVLALAEKASGEVQPDYAASLSMLAQVKERQGHYAEAEELLRQVLAIHEKTLGQTNPGYATSLGMLARVLRRQGQYTEAEGLLRQVSAIYEKAWGGDHPDYATSLYELARVLENQSRYAEAEGLLRQVLAIYEKALGQAHPDFATSLRELARVLERQGRYTEAEGLLRQASGIYEKALGEAHPNYAASLAVLATVLGRQGRYAEAEGLLRQVLAIHEKALGKAHHYFAIALRGLAQLQEMQGRYIEAEGLLLQGLAVQEKSLGAAHPDLCSTLTLLGFALTMRDRAQEGEPFLRRAAEISLATWGLHHRVTAQALHRLAQAEAALKKPEAAATAQQAIEAFLKSLGPEHPLTKEALPELNLILARSGSS